MLDPVRHLFACALWMVCGAALAAGSAPPGDTVRLYVFDCGRIDVRNDALFHPAGHVGKPMTLTDACYLVVHPKGSLMWDTGLADALAAQPRGKQIGGGVRVRLARTLASQMRQVGIAPKDVTYLGLSHMHFDHIGNVALFPRATLLMQQEELDAAFGADAAKFGNDPATYPTLRGNPAQPLTGDHDVFGDGRVVIKRATGHTPGHQALFVKLANSGNVLLSGDLTIFAANWKSRHVPGFNFDQAQSTRTMNETAAFLAANRATLWIQHDAPQHKALRHAPAFYD